MSSPVLPGQRVTFVRPNLGASKRDELSRVTNEVYGPGDVGTVAFPHPNQKACTGWFYVEVDSKEEPGAKRYIGVHPGMVAAVPR